MNVLIASMTDFHTDNGFRLLVQHSSRERRKKALQYKHKNDQIRCLLGEIMVKYWISKSNNLDFNNTSVKFSKSKFGKPFILDPYKQPFNISHSESYVVCTFSKRKVGIDIELIKPIDYTLLYEFFLPSEVLNILSQKAGLRCKSFYDLWTAKESYLKAIGTGLHKPLNSFEVIINHQSGEISPIKNEYGLFYFQQINILKLYSFTVCQEGYIDNIRVDKFTPQNIIPF